MRKAQRLGLLENSIVAVGNAPTALLEVIRMIKKENLRPALFCAQYSIQTLNNYGCRLPGRQ
jgi:precorrin isomerase